MSASPVSRRQRRRRSGPMSEINVVPYIDVMLVLLVIFMVTAPLLYQGVDIDLPESTAEPLSEDDHEPLIVEVDRNGQFFMSIGAQAADEPVSAEEVVRNVATVMRQNPDTPVYVRGDGQVNYARVVEVMAALQGAGVPRVGLMTEPPADGG